MFMVLPSGSFLKALYNRDNCCRTKICGNIFCIQETKSHKHVHYRRKDKTMDTGQENFYNFIVGRVREECIEDAKALLKENFAKQDNGTFSREDIVSTQQALLKMLKPEALEEVKAAMAHFSA